MICVYIYIYIICTSDTGTRIVCEATSWLDVSPARDFDYEARYFPCWTLPLPTWYWISILTGFRTL